MLDFNSLISLCEKEKISYRRDERLAAHTSFRIGGPAALFCETADIRGAAMLAAEAVKLDLPFFVLGKGSNLLFADEGYNGVIIHIGKGIGELRQIDDETVCCGSGASLASLCEFARDKGLSGLEFAFGIPGSVGGAIYMNAGAYGGEIKDVLIKAEHLGYDGSEGFFEGDALSMSYRGSVYSGGGYIITGGYFRLKKDAPDAISARMKDYMGRRRDKQPLEWPSAGSTFKRPVGGYASELIDRCGLKGLRVGGAVVSEKHAGFIINDGGATARDVLTLIEKVRAEVLRQTGIDIEPEVELVGTGGKS